MHQLSLSQPDSKAQWVSSAPSVASVDAKGKVTAKALGSAVIYAVSSQDFGLFESWIVTVENTAATASLQINLRSAGLKVGQTVQLSASGAEKEIIKQENSDRMVIYMKLAARNGVAVEEIEKLYAKRLQESLPPGAPVEVFDLDQGAYVWRIK